MRLLCGCENRNIIFRGTRARAEYHINEELRTSGIFESNSNMRLLCGSDNRNIFSDGEVEYHRNKEVLTRVIVEPNNDTVVPPCLLIREKLFTSLTLIKFLISDF